LRGAAATGAAAIATIALAACGEEQRAENPPAMSSPRVALTASIPGYAPFALITYRDEAGRRCHGVGSVTANGPRVMGALGKPLAEGLRTGGRCLRATDSDVSIQVRRVGRGTARVVGGIAREGVTRVVVGGQGVRPAPGGGFLVVQPAGSGGLGNEVELEYQAGHHRTLPLPLASS
jgi:hypothetical protein